MATTINQKITGWSVKKEAETAPAAAPVADVVEMHEKLKRPQELHGTTYKVKSPDADNALYIVINDLILNEGTEHERRQPCEIFINSRDMSTYQWVSALTLVLSAVFRKGGDVTFLAEELKQVFDPKGGYFSGGQFVPSLVAEIGGVIEKHMIAIGMIQAKTLDANQQALIDSKKAELAAKADAEAQDSGYPPNATLCTKCLAKAVVVADGCKTCIACADSKCG